ncbi:MAG: FtsW/RodA/SpoVE family cell cycle protein [Alphaproteobacteria bacterium]|nr:FtsW/RodA/SpoVE family cell cycle protein [Alphaproteobacteria bacterium]
MRVSRLDNSLVSRWWLSIDKTILALALFLTVMGLFMMFSAAPYAADRIKQGGFFYFRNYPIYLVLGLAAMFVISTQRARTLERLAPLAFIVLIGLTVWTLFNRPINGAHRWIFLWGFQLQPSEFLKPITALLLATLIAKFKREPDPRKRKFLGWFMAIMAAAIAGILTRQPDYGMTATFLIAIFGVQIFLAGAKLRWVFLAAGIAICGIFLAYKIVPHVNSRVEKFLSKDVKDRHQIDASLRSIRNAGLIGGGRTNLRQHIPDVHTDFVFAAMVESFGILLAVAVIAAAFALSLSILSKATHRNPTAYYACSGIAGYLVFQYCVNISSALGIIPPKGMTMPFISSGGSSLISSYMAIGIVLCLLRPQKEEIKK